MYLNFNMSEQEETIRDAKCEAIGGVICGLGVSYIGNKIYEKGQRTNSMALMGVGLVTEGIGAINAIKHTINLFKK